MSQIPLQTHRTYEKQRFQALGKLILPAKPPIIPNDRRKTLLITEQSELLYLKRSIPMNFPKKKFRALVPDEYSKFILKENRVQLNTFSDPMIKYIYPSQILSNSQIDKLKSDEFFRLKSKCYKSSVRRLKTIQ